MNATTGQVNTNARACVRTTILSPGIVETAIRGKITRETIVQAFDDLEGYSRAAIWMVDLTRADGYEASAIPTATERIITARRRGLEKLIAVAPSTSIRMAASVVRLSTSFPLIIVETRAEAMRIAE